MAQEIELDEHIKTDQFIPLADGKQIHVQRGRIEKAGAERRRKMCTDGVTPSDQFCPQVEIEGVAYDVVEASIGFTIAGGNPRLVAPQSPTDPS